MQEQVNPKYTTPHYSTKMWRAYKLYLNHHYGKDLFSNICQQLDMPESYISRDDNWVSDEFARKFREILIRETGDREIARKVGQFSISPDVINNIEYNIIKSLPPLVFFRLVKSNAPKLNRLYDIDVKRNRSGQFELTMTTRDSFKADNNVFLNTLGWIEAIQELFQLENFKVNFSTNVLADGRERASFLIFYSEKKWWLKKIRYFSISFFALAATYFTAKANLEKIAHLNHYMPAILTAVTAVLLIILEGFSHFQKITRYLRFYYKQEKEKALELYNSSLLIERKYQEAKLLDQLSSELIGCRDPREVINKCLCSMREKFAFDKVAVFLLTKEQKSLYLSSGIGFENAQIDSSKIEFAYPNPQKNEAFVANVLEAGKSVLIDQIDSYKKQLKPVNAYLLEVLDVGSMIVSPIQANEQKFGAVLVARTKNEENLSVEDRKLIDQICTQLSLYFESATWFENEKKLKHIFKKYVPKQVLDQISTTLHATDGSLKPQKKEICSVFMDLRGFTRACDKLSPEKSFDLINMFADFVTKILSDEGAIIDNIIGDEVVAFFPKNDTSPYWHINSALKACIRIQSEYPDLHQVFNQNGIPWLRLGIGINCGDASIGSVGGDAKMNFTAIGSTINVASRLQALTKNYTEDAVSIVVAKAALLHFSFSNFVKYESEMLRGTSEATEFLKLDEPHLKLLQKKFLQTEQQGKAS